jgi:glycosyltransferase involved in cell wall biosynthesis
MNKEIGEIIIFNSTYPDYEYNEIGDEFVRVRAEAYKKNGYRVKVIGQNDSYRKYNYNGIEVEKFVSKKEILSYLRSCDSSIILVHFIPGWLAREVKNLKNKKFIIWVHGWEALAWYRRVYVLNRFNFLKFVLSNIIQLLSLRYLIKLSNKRKVDCEFVFVSDWMRKICETDCFIRVKRFNLIPNPIDDNFFNTEEKKDNFKNILLIRSFSNRKYATDLAVKFVKKLKENETEKIKVLIVGKGIFFKKDVYHIKNLPDVTIQEGFLSKDQIKEYHKNFGFFLCPTRQDAQGVSMCEAMASGLIPITNNSTAIPEFVTKGESGIIEDTIELQIDNYKEIIKSYSNWERVSKNARNEIINKAGINVVIENEIKLFDAKPY